MKRNLKFPVVDPAFEQAEPIDFSRFDVAEKEYREDPRLNFHTLANFRRDPKAFRAGYFDLKEETDAMRFGSALHAKLLTPEFYAKQYAVFDAPINTKTGEPFGSATNAYKSAYEAFAEDNAGKTILSQSDAKLIDTLIDEFYFHQYAPSILSGEVQAEKTIVGALSFDGQTVVEVKGRIDAFTGAGLIDVKTTANLDDASGRDRFRYAVYDYKYLIQLAFYHRILTECYGAAFCPCWLIVLEKNPPNRVAVYAPTRRVIEDCYKVVDAWLERWYYAKSSGTYSSRFDEIQVIDSYDCNRDF